MTKQRNDDEFWEDAFFDDDDDDVEEFILFDELMNNDDRKPPWIHSRIDFKKNIEKLEHEGRFPIRYRMPVDDFHVLVCL